MAAIAASAAGLTEAEARRRLAERGPVAPPATSRSTASIVRANVFTVFNAILLVLGVLALDRLAALVAPHATVVRDGAPRKVDVDDVVVGDLVRVQAGDQVVADGTL